MPIFSLIAAACLMLSPLAATAQTPPAPMVIYDDTLMPGWDNWSWAKTTLSVDIKSDIKPIAVEGDAWTALAFHHEAFSTKGYTKLTFFVNGGPTGGQPIAVRALSGGKALPSTYLIHLQANTWNAVEVPLSDISAADTTIDGIWLQAMTDKPYGTYYVTVLQFE